MIRREIGVTAQMRCKMWFLIAASFLALIIIQSFIMIIHAGFIGNVRISRLKGLNDKSQIANWSLSICA